MADEIDTFGNLATAALAAREFDRGSLHDPGAPGHCANCAAPVAERFCAHCGQPTHVHRSVLHVIEEFLHGITHFDSKSWRTLPLLAFRPGQLTYDYVHGKRARYVPPVTLFLLTVFLMFFAFSFVKGPTDLSIDTSAIAKATPAERAKLVADSDHAVALLEAELKKAQADPNRHSDIAGINIALATARAANTGLHRAATGTPVFQSDETGPIMTVSSALKVLRAADKRGELTISSRVPGLDARVRHALDNPDLTLYKVQSKAYKFSFLLVPLSLPVLWLLFVFRRHVYLYDHTVFALYSLSFMSIIVVLASTMFAAGYRGALYAPLLLLVPPLHMYVQLKGAYQLTVFGALWRATVLATAALCTLTFFAVLIALLGVVD